MINETTSSMIKESKKQQGTTRGRGGRPAANEHKSDAYLDGPEDVLLHELLAEVLNVHLVVVVMT